MNTDSSSNKPRKIIAIVAIVLLLIVFISSIYWLLTTPEEPVRVEPTKPVPAANESVLTPPELPRTGVDL